VTHEVTAWLLLLGWCGAPRRGIIEMLACRVKMLANVEILLGNYASFNASNFIIINTNILLLQLQLVSVHTWHHMYIYKIYKS
jgi:hypothetical protein